MMVAQSIRQLACLAACVFFASPTLAAPIDIEIGVPKLLGASGKRVVLWDPVLSNEKASIPGILKSAGQLAGSKAIKSVFNWNTKRPAEVPKTIPFRPTVWGPAHLQGDAWSSLVAEAAAQKGNAIVHFFNEPERQGIDPGDAAAKWKAQMLPLRRQYGVKLASPACASDPDGIQWLQAFMGKLGSSEKPDYVNAHFYTLQNSASAAEVENAKAFFKRQHDTYKLPMIGGEIASVNRDRAQVDLFTKEVSKWLDAQSWVVEYGFFGVSTKPADTFVSPAAQLMDGSGGWTDLGRWFFGV
ncbi:glycoside hydrolase family 128 protein [Hypoxylon fragiforme]|uniref:glycoside hydrolase family 128 protein n=1 Tax=Hypoxylon fragiforme TaxID=63214 RepID=UPI0020C5D380|nr:glycoside hydrolase family 128 protein [Hypoxylon fragiforme]KAI2605124.1 glycoside hydrolase family 128 protein [Hypoxylon fragiforme]